jgi:hypothetical protein
VKAERVTLYLVDAQAENLLVVIAKDLKFQSRSIPIGQGESVFFLYISILAVVSLLTAFSQAWLVMVSRCVSCGHFRLPFCFSHLVQKGSCFCSVSLTFSLYRLIIIFLVSFLLFPSFRENEQYCPNELKIM